MLFKYAYLTGCKGPIISAEIPPPLVVLFAEALFKILWRSFSYPSYRFSFPELSVAAGAAVGPGLLFLAFLYFSICCDVDDADEAGVIGVGGVS